MNDLDTALRRSLHADAERAPAPLPTWQPTALRPDAQARGPRRTGGFLAAVGGLAAAAAVVGVLVVADRAAASVEHDQAASQSLPVPWHPDGTEFPIADLGPIQDTGMDSITLGELTRQVGVEGHPAGLHDDAVHRRAHRRGGAVPRRRRWRRMRAGRPAKV